MASNTPRLDLVERNLMLNGAMDFFQRGTTFTNAAHNSVTADRFRTTKVLANAGTFDISKNTDAPTQAQSGFQAPGSLNVQCTATETLAAGDILRISQNLEGQDYAAIHGRPVRLQFWVKTNLAGNYGV